MLNENVYYYLGFFSTKLKKKELPSNFPSCPIYQTNWKSFAPLSEKFNKNINQGKHQQQKEIIE